MIEIDLPLHKGKPPLTANLRLHWSEKARRTKKIRDAAGWAAKAAKLGLCEHITVQLHYATGDGRRRDSDNLVATQKPAIDGLVDAGVIVDDDPRHITWWQPQIHLGPGPRRLWLTVTVTDLSEPTGRAPVIALEGPEVNPREPIKKPCPHAKCEGTINVPRNLPNGTYDCICHAIKLRVSWMTTASFERVPMLSVEPRT